MSDCSRRRLDSSVSAGGAKTGELRELESSVGGVEDLEGRDSEAALDAEPEVRTDGCGREAAVTSS